VNLKKLLSIMFVLVILVSTASGVFAYFTSSFDFGVEDAEKKVFDLQVKLRNLTTGNLTEKLLNNPDLTKNFEKLSPPSVSYAFGTDYLLTLLSSSSSSSLPSSSASARFPEIAFLGMSVKKGTASLTLSVSNNVQIWVLRYENGKWVTKDAPFGAVEDVNLTRDAVSFVLSLAGERKRYEFAVAAVPAQYASP